MKLKKEMAKGGKTFIFKPKASEQGQGIILAQRFADVPDFVLSQDYVA